MYEDAGCAFPCGGEPMNCRTCPDYGNITVLHDKNYYSELFATMDQDEFEDYLDYMEYGD